VRPANQRTITGVALCHEKFGDPCVRVNVVLDPWFIALQFCVVSEWLIPEGTILMQHVCGTWGNRDKQETLTVERGSLCPYTRFVRSISWRTKARDRCMLNSFISVKISKALTHKFCCPLNIQDVEASARCRLPWRLWKKKYCRQGFYVDCVNFGCGSEHCVSHVGCNDTS
jgi:hypothetical protein